MATLLAKSLAVLGGIGGASVVGGGIYYLNNSKDDSKPKEVKKTDENTQPAKPNTPKKKIIDLLKADNNKAIIADGETDKWSQNWIKFRDKHRENPPTGDWHIAEWDNKKNENNGLEDFKKLCKANVEKEESEDLLNKVKEYCVG